MFFSLFFSVIDFVCAASLISANKNRNKHKERWRWSEKRNSLGIVRDQSIIEMTLGSLGMWSACYR